MVFDRFLNLVQNTDDLGSFQFYQPKHNKRRKKDAKTECV